MPSTCSFKFIQTLFSLTRIAKYAKSALGKLDNEIKTYKVNWNIVKTASDNVYLTILPVLFDLND